MTTPTVSIIMPFFNAAKYLEETVDSIIAQTYTDWELIIVDDQSTDFDSVLVLEHMYGKDNRIKFLRTKRNGGAGYARNLGIDVALGRYIAFCDSDDWWYPTKLEEQLAYMQKNNYEFTCTYYEDSDEFLTPYYTMRQAEKMNYKDLIYGCNIGTPGVIIDTKRIGKKKMPELRRAEDWGLWLMVLREVDYLHTYPKALWKYRHVPGSTTGNKWKQLKAVAKMYRDVLGMSFVRGWLVCFFVFLPLNILKKIRKL